MKGSFLRQIGKAVALLCILTVSFSACNYKKQYEQSGNNYGSQVGKLNQQPKMYGLQEKGGINHNNHELQFRQDLSSMIERLPGIATSIVMLTDKNAYVAIMLDYTGTGTKGKGTRSETDNTGSNLGLFDPYSTNQYADPNKLATDTNSYFTVYDHEEIAHELKQKIALQMRKAVPYVREVHISANRDFINQMNIYAMDARKGMDLNAYVDEFNNNAIHFFGVKP